MKRSDIRQSICTPKVMVAFTCLLLLVGLSVFIMKKTSGRPDLAIQALIDREATNEEQLERKILAVKEASATKEEQLEKKILAVKEASDSKMELLLKKTKDFSDIMAEALNKIEELKSTQSTIQRLKSSIVKGGKVQELEVVDNSGARAYLESFHQTLGRSDPMKADPNNGSTITLWWEAAAMLAWYMNPPENVRRHPCKNMTLFGNWPLCQDEPFIVKKPCLIYSFGIANDFSFDDALGRIGCKVHSFDPSMNQKNHVRNENVTFYNMGIAAHDTNSWEPYKDSYVKDNQIWKVRTLKSIMSELNHEHKTLDILKMDVETTEWTVVNNIIQTDLLKNIRILLVEYHLFPTRPYKGDYVYFYKMLTHLREMGFREFLFEPCCLRTVNPNDFNYQSHVGYFNYNYNV